jgi:hypothetical protein
MALLIQKDVSIMGLNISQFYMRFDYSVDYKGKKVLTNNKVYVSRNAYDNDPINNIVTIPEIKTSLGFEYDRNIDGLDILSFIHEEWKSHLSTDVTKEVYQRDPSTGKILRDPSTNEILTETIVNIPKFVDPGDVSIVDLN